MILTASSGYIDRKRTDREGFCAFVPERLHPTGLCAEVQNVVAEGVVAKARRQARPQPPGPKRLITIEGVVGV